MQNYKCGHPTFKSTVILKIGSYFPHFSMDTLIATFALSGYSTCYVCKEPNAKIHKCGHPAHIQCCFEARCPQCGFYVLPEFAEVTFRENVLVKYYANGNVLITLKAIQGFPISKMEFMDFYAEAVRGYLDAHTQHHRAWSPSRPSSRSRSRLIIHSFKFPKHLLDVFFAFLDGY